MKIADRAVATPAIRSQPLQSTCSCASATNTRSPFASAPAGPPIGPASAARPPSRAIATAALAAQPPLTTKKSCACVLASGRGKLSTRNTSSSTMIPAHRMAGRGGGTLALSEVNLFLHPGTDDVIGDRHGGRRAQPLWMRAQQHAGDLFAIEPACVFEFGAVDDDLVGQGFGVAADHQRGRKRPRLRPEIVHASTDDAGFLAGFPPHRLLDGLAGLDEAGET